MLGDKMEDSHNKMVIIKRLQNMYSSFKKLYTYVAENARCPQYRFSLPLLIHHANLIQESNTCTSKMTLPTTLQPDVTNEIWAELLCGTLGRLFKENWVSFKGCPFALLPFLLPATWKVNVMFGTLSAVLDHQKKPPKTQEKYPGLAQCSRKMKWV